MPLEFVPFRTCRNGEEVEAIVFTLQDAGIAFKTSSTTAHFDLTSIGSGQDGQVIVSVAAADMAAASQAVTKAEEATFEDIAEDHYFHDYDDYELGQVLASDFEWSAHDVACARSLLEKRGILPTDDAINEAREKYLELLRQGIQSNRALLIFGFLIAIFGGFPWLVFPVGIVSTLMGLSFMTMKKTDPLGITHYVYNQASRTEGRILFLFSILSIMIWIGIYLIGYRLII